MDMNCVQIAIWVGLLAALLLSACILYVTWQNRGSQAMVFAAGTVISAIIFLCIQAGYELRRNSRPSWVSTYISIDLGASEISLPRPQRVSDLKEFNPHSYIGQGAASDWLKQHADFKNHDLQKLVADFVVLNILEMISLGEPDWQMRTVTFGGRRGVEVSGYRYLSKPSECLYVTKTHLQEKLTRADNFFAGALVSLGDRTAFPPKSVIEVTTNSVVLRNPVCQITFTVESRGSDSISPVPSGNPPEIRNDDRYFNGLFGIDIDTVYFATRAKSPDADKYREWSERLVGDCARWFGATQE
jgi:hypothetical protein